MTDNPSPPHGKIVTSLECRFFSFSLFFPQNRRADRVSELPVLACYSSSQSTHNHHQEESVTHQRLFKQERSYTLPADPEIAEQAIQGPSKRKARRSNSYAVSHCTYYIQSILQSALPPIINAQLAHFTAKQQNRVLGHRTGHARTHGKQSAAPIHTHIQYSPSAHKTLISLIAPPFSARLQHYCNVVCRQCSPPHGGRCIARIVLGSH